MTIADLLIDCEQGDVIGLQRCEKNGCCFAVVVKRKSLNRHLLEFKRISHEVYQALQVAPNMAQKRAVLAGSEDEAMEGSCNGNWINECRIMPES
jgi:hypothetical protein